MIGAVVHYFPTATYRYNLYILYMQYVVVTTVVTYIRSCVGTTGGTKIQTAALHYVSFPHTKQLKLLLMYRWQHSHLH